VILLDMTMPVMAGYEFRAEQEKDSWIAYIPIVVMTAGNSVDEKATKIGARAFLKKPLEISDLLAVAQQFCS
jgi:CheY-like chemotaxis protein